MVCTETERDPMQEKTETRKPGVCIPWEEKRSELGPIRGDPKVFQTVWEEVDGLAYMYIWQVLLSF
jgi:hypothetical protein